MIIIVGRSGSGKTELVKQFCTLYPEYHRVVTYTTRAKRSNETDGIDYNFIDTREFHYLYSCGTFAETACYNGWYYGTPLEIEDDEHAIAVLTPSGMREFRKHGKNPTVVELDVDRRTCLISTLNRGDDIEEAYRRSLSDVGMFDGIDNEVNFILENKKQIISATELAKILHSEVTK